MITNFQKINSPLVVGQQSNYTVLNVLGRDFMKARYVQDRLNLGRPDIVYYSVNFKIYSNSLSM